MLNVAKFTALGLFAVLVMALPRIRPGCRRRNPQFRSHRRRDRLHRCRIRHRTTRRFGPRGDVCAAEVAGSIQTAMIIAAALIEGFTFFALFVCLQQNPFAAG